MEGFWLPLGMTAAFGVFSGLLFRLSRAPGYERPFLFPLLGLMAGFIAFFIHLVLVRIANAPDWLLPVLVVLLVWLWLRPFGTRFHRSKKE
ncbi:hypothetical protein [Litchfieldella rifensis]|uniref:Integral membrane protein n=1 Tax=Litchfieldella rifensis TaxID=762643 RepID=A0ABV7LKA6_9GAMM